MPAPDRRHRITAFVVAMAVLIAAPMVVVATDAFTDVPDANVHHNDITWLRDAGVTFGCNPPANTEYCPGDPVLRQQMASFMRRLAQNKVVDAATAVHAETAGDAETLNGLDANDLSTLVVAATGSFIEGTSVDLTVADQTLIARSVEITAPAPGALIVHTTSSWDLGTFVVHSWAELNTTPGCDPDYFDGDPLTGSFATDAAEASVDEARANLAGIAVVEVPSGTHTVHHCFQLFEGDDAINLDHALTVQWLPSSSTSLTLAGGSSSGTTQAPAGGSSKR